MTHIRIDNEINNSQRKFACGIGPAIPEGDTYVSVSESSLHDTVDCPGCRPQTHTLGTPISQLSGRPGHRGFDRFVEIARSWGHE